jgi:hypothetical protein
LQGFTDNEELEIDFDEEEEEIEIGDPASKKGGKSIPPDLRGFLEEQTKEQLITLLKDLSERYPSVRQDLQDRQNLYLAKLRQDNARKSKLIEILSRLEGRRIVESI